MLTGSRIHSAMMCVMVATLLLDGGCQCERNEGTSCDSAREHWPALNTEQTSENTLGAAVAQEVSAGLVTGRLLVQFPGSA